MAKKKIISKHELALEALLLKLFPTLKPEREYRFDNRPKDKDLGLPRRWRFDFAYPDAMIAFEIEGGTWNGGRHVNPIGFAADCEKYNAAVGQGWQVYRLVPKMINEEYLTELLYFFPIV